mmetsp:Transcript_31806/g.87555  ORF Transcript_31806/g.87555 Transcript_31806/m.87555 type:complete len:258 (+) Transcript_31806:67-840(+)
MHAPSQHGMTGGASRPVGTLTSGRLLRAPPWKRAGDYCRLAAAAVLPRAQVPQGLQRAGWEPPGDAAWEGTPRPGPAARPRTAPKERHLEAPLSDGRQLHDAPGTAAGPSFASFAGHSDPQEPTAGRPSQGRCARRCNRLPASTRNAKHANDLGVTLECGQNQRRDAVCAGLLPVSASLAESVHGCKMPREASHEKRCGAMCCCFVDISSSIAENPKYVCVPLVCRHMQGRRTVCGLLIQIGTDITEHAHHIQVTLL